MFECLNGNENYFIVIVIIFSDLLLSGEHQRGLAAQSVDGDLAEAAPRPPHVHLDHLLPEAQRPTQASLPLQRRPPQKSQGITQKPQRHQAKSG